MADSDAHPWIFDYVIVGAGVAGCILANRLTASRKLRVCLLEAGPRDRNLDIQIPAGFIRLLGDPRFTWQTRTEAHPATAGRQLPISLGRTLGGSSSVNGFNYTRGQPEDFDAWAGAGNRGWGYADVLPYFKRSERRIGFGDEIFRGRDGLLAVTDSDWRHPLCEAFIASAAEAGLPFNPDYNGARQRGAGYYQRWILHGWRQSCARAFLSPAMRRRNLTVLTDARVIKVLLDGKRAIGVTASAGAEKVEANILAEREVIVAAGAINSPSLLMHSGIGDARALGNLGIQPVHDLPGVGANLQDHYLVRSASRVRGVTTLNEASRGWRRGIEALRWLVRQPSILAISPSVAFGFASSDPAVERPDLQFHFSPGSFKDGVAGVLDDSPGMTLGFYPQRPLSRGRVSLASANPDQPPVIQPNYLADEADRCLTVAGLKMTRQLLRGQALARYRVDDHYPPADATSDDDLLGFAARQGTAAMHFVGTCRMGPQGDPGAVVDPTLQVIGIDHLRVVDASVMPSLPSANTQAATMMIAEKAADLILGETPPAPVGLDDLAEARGLGAED